MFAPVLSQLAVQAGIHRIGFAHRPLVLRQGYGGSAFHVRHEQREGFADAVAPLRNVTALQPASGLVGRLRLHQLALATHALLTVLVSVIKVRQVDAYRQHARQCQHARCLQEAGESLFLPCLHAERDCHKEHHEEEVIRHLQVVRHYLKCGEKRGDDTSCPILAAIRQHHSRNGRRYVGKRDEFPDMSGGYDDEEIRGERPYNRSQCRHPDFEIKCTKQDVKSQQHHKHVPYIRGQIQMIQVLHRVQRTARIISRSQLICRHSAEQRVRPTGHLSVFLMIFLMFASGSDTRYRIVLRQDAPLEHRRIEVSKRNRYKKHNRRHIRKKFL